MTDYFTVQLIMSLFHFAKKDVLNCHIMSAKHICNYKSSPLAAGNIAVTTTFSVAEPHADGTVQAHESLVQRAPEAKSVLSIN